MPDPAPSTPDIPLARWADTKLQTLGVLTGSPAIAAIGGTCLLGERAALSGFSIPRRRSAGGKCHLLAARDGWVALNLARDCDRDLLPALFQTRMIDTGDLGEIADLIFRNNARDLVDRGREMGLALAASNENVDPGKAVTVLCTARPAQPPQRAPLVIDLSGLWAGPLCGHLLQAAGAQVVKVESRQRPDAMRDGDPAFFDRLNQGKDNVAIDLGTEDGRSHLHHLIGLADIVIEASRPRALQQLGIDAEAYVAARPGKTWVTITGHGAMGDAAHWIGFGDDCAIAGGLGQAQFAASGAMGFVGDAIADPLTGLLAASTAWDLWQSGRGGRVGIAMSAVVARALAEERARDSAALDHDLRCWATSAGRPFPTLTIAPFPGPARSLGADNSRWLGGGGQSC